MSDENVEVFRRGVASFNQRDEDAIDDLFTEDFEFIPYLAALVETTTYRGREGLRQYFEDAEAAWENFEVQVDEIRDLGDRAIAFGEIRGRGRGSGLEARVSLAWVADFRHRKFSRLQSYGDATEALEAAGVRENAEVVLQEVEAVNRRDADAFVATVSPEVEWEDSMSWSEVARTYRGKAEVREWFKQVVVDPWESLHSGVEEIEEVGDDRVFFGGLLTARSRDTGAETNQRFWSVAWITDGQVTRRKVFLERAEALEAAGLSE
jgi:ketosteroid isomerase-like protein